MRVLFDQAAPVPVRPYLERHTVSTAFRQGWDKLKNGGLLDAAAEQAGFDVFLTTDKNMRYQQSLARRTIAIVVLSQQWPYDRPYVQRVVDAINAASPGSYTEVEIPYESKPRLVNGLVR